MCHKRCCFVFLFFCCICSIAFTFHLLDKRWSWVSSFLPHSGCLRFYRAEGSASPLRAGFRRVLLKDAFALSATEQDSENVQIMFSTRDLVSCTTAGEDNYLFLVLHRQIIPCEAPSLIRFLRWSEYCYRIFQNVRRSGARFGA